jgi:hypothetical protein
MKFTPIAIQGDLFIIKIDKIPSGAKKRDNLILVEGESTGHAHRLSEGEVYDYQDRLLFTVPANATIIHEEHRIIPLPEKGTYEIIRQRQKSKDSMTKLVID